MKLWSMERGTLWGLEISNALPPIYSARVETTFQEEEDAGIADLTIAMGLPTSQLIQQRLQGNRRCFSLRAEGPIVAYGWVTHGAESVGELERQFHLRDDEAYIWDCGTTPAWRGRGCYSALLSQIIRRLKYEDVARIWIGASRQNQPSVRGIANAGFQPAVDVIYRRFYRLTLLWIDQSFSSSQPLVADAYRILLSEHERRFGRLAIGYRP